MGYRHSGAGQGLTVSMWLTKILHDSGTYSLPYGAVKSIVLGDNEFVKVSDHVAI